MAETAIVASFPRYHAKVFRIPNHREPTHPGEMLLREFLEPMALTQRELADGIHVPYQRVNELVHARRGVTPSTALRLGKYLGTSPSFWMKPSTSLGTSTTHSVPRPSN